MAYEIKNRSGAVIYTSEKAVTAKEAVVEAVAAHANLRDAYLGGADLRGADLRGAYLRDANLRNAYLRNADLRGADLGGANLGGADLRGADLRNADLRGADLRGADLRNANLRNAYLRNADLRNADLRGADLRGANLGDQWIIQGQTRSDGYPFFLQKLTGDTSPMVNAGCRHFPIAEARAHWGKTRGGTSLGAETTAILDCMEAVMKIRGLS